MSWLTSLQESKHILIRFFYEFFLLLFFLFTLPYTIYQLIFHGKYRRSFLKRLGIGLSLPERKSGMLIWVHAVSVGEAKAVSTLINILYEQYPNSQFVFSSVTETGFDEACRSVKVPCFHLFFPLDFGFILKPILKKLKPDLVLMSETDFWPRFLTLSKESGASIALVNGKISLRSAKRLKSFPLFAKFLFDPIDLFLVQSEEYKRQFTAIGVDKAKIFITGNLKNDQKIISLTEKEKEALRKKIAVSSQEKIIVIGSTHEGEERLLLEALRPVEGVKILLVPRHPERFDQVARLLESMNIPYSRYSQETGDTRVVLIDSMGVLTSLYQIADVAIVAGSFCPGVGGHNILEPLGFDVPVLFGPYMESQQEMRDLVLRLGAGVEVKPESIAEKVIDLLQNPSLKKSKESFKQELSGSSNKTANFLKKLLAEKEEAVI